MPKVAAKKPEPAPAAKPAPPPKPLSRLEKLRLAAKKRQEARNAGGGGE
jgi:hypothetical protein